MRRLLAFSTMIALPLLPAAAQAESSMSFGVYLWQDPDHDPIRAQFLSLAGGQAEVEIDGPEGSSDKSRPTTPEETALMTAAIKEQIATLKIEGDKLPTGPYLTVEWHYSNDSGYADGSAAYTFQSLPATVTALQQAAFGTLFSPPK